MEIDELKKIWRVYDQKLERNWQLNLHLLRQTNLDKAKSKLRYLVMLHAFSLAICIPLCLLFLYFVFSHIEAFHFVLAGSILFFWTAFVAYSAIEQLRIIQHVDYSAPVIIIQKKLASLKLVMIKYLRLGIWIMPFYVAHILLWFELIFDLDMYQVADQRWWISQVIFSLIVIVPLTVWLYRKLSPKNVNKAWMKKLIGGSGGKQLNDAIACLEEIEKFEKMEQE